MGDINDFRELNALRGMDGRASAIQDRRAAAQGRRYMTIPEGGELRDWDDDTDEQGHIRPSATRKPKTQMGIEGAIVSELVDLTTGEGQLPAWKAMQGDAVVDDMATFLGEDHMELAFHAPLVTWDLYVAGSVCEGFGFVFSGPRSIERVDHVRLATEWCEPVFAGTAKTARAKALADEVAAVGGSVMPDEEGGRRFRIRPGAAADDLVFLRYQWPEYKREEDFQGASSYRDVLYVHRRDYTDTEIIEYKPVRILETDEVAPRFEALPFTPHRFGVVPLAWAKARPAAAEDIDGPSVLSEPVLSLSMEADYCSSFYGGAVKVSAAPNLKEIDAVDDQAQAEMRRADGGRPMTFDVESGPNAVIKRRSRDSTHQAQVEYLEISGEGPKAALDATQNFTRFAYSAARVVQHDPERSGGALSGAALEREMRPTVAKVKGARKVLARLWSSIIEKLAIALDVYGMIDLPGEGPVRLVSTWPSVIPKTAADLQALAAALAAAVIGGMLSLESAVRIFAPAAGVEDVAAELELLGIIEGDGGPAGGGAPEGTPQELVTAAAGLARQLRAGEIERDAALAQLQGLGASPQQAEALLPAGPR